MNLVTLSLKFLTWKAKNFERATKDPVSAQKKVLFECLGRNKKTEYGLRYGFSAISSVEDFQSRVPLSDCETMRPAIGRMAGGGLNILTRDRPVFFGSTSGTTAAQKLIPSTKFSESKKTELLDLWSYYISRDHPDVADGKILAIVSPEVEGYSEAGIPFGAESGHGYRNLPKLVRHLYVLPYEVFEIRDFDARYYSILRIAMAHNVTNIATINPKTLVLLCQKIEKWREDIISDIESGGINKKFDLPENIRGKIRERSRPNPARASRLREILNEKGALLPKYFWPNLKLIECWKGGAMKLYLKDLPAYFGNVPTRDIGCLSTEARSSIPMSDDGAGGTLAIQTNFYEFIPKEDMGKSGKRPLLCDALEKDKEYFIIVTTPGGLYRYNIDDIIRVDGFFNKTPVIEFVQKGLNATSLAGEKLYESQVNDALNKVLDRMEISVEFFCAVADPEGIPRYNFLVEFSDKPPLPPEEKKNFLKLMEEGLCQENREYKYMRNAQMLGGPVLKVARSGDFERYRIKRVEAGAHDGQFKTPELTSDINFQNNFRIEEELSLGTSTAPGINPEHLPKD